MKNTINYIPRNEGVSACPNLTLYSRDVININETRGSEERGVVTKHILGSSAAYDKKDRYIGKEELLKSNVETKEEIIYHQRIHQSDDIELYNSSSSINHDMNEYSSRTPLFIWSDEDIHSQMSIEELKIKNNGANITKAEKKLDSLFITSENSDKTSFTVNESKESCSLSINNSIKLDINKDIKENVNILAQLYPETRKINKKIPDSVNSNFDFKSSYGWNRMGLIQRYDPRTLFSQDLEVPNRKIFYKEFINECDKSYYGVKYNCQQKDRFLDKESSCLMPNNAGFVTTIKNNNTKDEESKDKCHVKYKSPKMTPNDMNNIVKDVRSKGSYIYEQEKLEKIFRGARNTLTSQTYKCAKEIANFKIYGDADESSSYTDASDSAVFKFGFTTRQSICNEQKNTSVINEMSIKDTKHDQLYHNETTQIRSTKKIENDRQLKSDIYDSTGKECLCSHDQFEVKSQHDIIGRRRKGITFPKSILMQYEIDFFRMNEGISVIKDVEVMKICKKSKDNWLKKRKILTLDWKRKQKYFTLKNHRKRKIQRFNTG